MSKNQKSFFPNQAKFVKIVIIIIKIEKLTVATLNQLYHMDLRCVSQTKLSLHDETHDPFFFHKVANINNGCLVYDHVLPWTKNSFQIRQIFRNACFKSKLKKNGKDNFWYCVPFLVNKFPACFGFDLITTDYKNLKEKLTEIYWKFSYEKFTESN